MLSMALETSIYRLKQRNVDETGHPTVKGSAEFFSYLGRYMKGTWRCTRPRTVLIQKHYFKRTQQSGELTHLVDIHSMGFPNAWPYPINCTFLQVSKAHIFRLFSVRLIPECHFGCHIGCHFGNGLCSHYSGLVDERTKPAKKPERVHKRHMSCLAKCMSGNADNYKNVDLIERKASAIDEAI